MFHIISLTSTKVVNQWNQLILTLLYDWFHVNMCPTLGVLSCQVPAHIVYGINLPSIKTQVSKASLQISNLQSFSSYDRNCFRKDHQKLKVRFKKSFRDSFLCAQSNHVHQAIIYGFFFHFSLCIPDPSFLFQLFKQHRN